MSIDRLRDIRFWIILFFLIRLIGITNPPLDRAHVWRQVSTNMYARNFLEVDNNPFYGRVDMAGDLTGITAKEFPVFNYGIYLLSEIFGFQHWFGRLINLAVSSLGLWFFYLIILAYFNKRTAFASTIILAGSIWIVYSRMIIPDTFSTSLVIIGSFYGLRYFREGKWTDLIWYGLWAGLGVLSKIPSIYLLGLFILPFFHRETTWRVRALFLIPSACILIANALWYGYWVPHVVGTYGYTHHSIKSFSLGLSEVLADPMSIAYRIYGTALYSYVAFGFFVIGLIFMIREKQRLLLYLLAILGFLFALVIIKAGRTFMIHSYYVVPFVPVMALITGFLIAKVKKQWLYTVILIVIVAESGANQMHHFWQDDWQQPKLELEEIADEFSSRNDLFIAPGDGSPVLLYFSHRKGWAPTFDEVLDDKWLEDVIDRGAKFMIIDKKFCPEELQDFKYPVVYDDEYFRIFRLLQKG